MIQRRRSNCTMLRPSASVRRAPGRRVPGVAVDHFEADGQLAIARAAARDSRAGRRESAARRGRARGPPSALVWPLARRSASRAAPSAYTSVTAPCPSPARRIRPRPACRPGRACRRKRARASAPAAARSSASVSGPSVLNISRPSAASTRWNSRSAGSGSAAQCRAMFDQTRSDRRAAASGSRVKSAHTALGGVSFEKAFFFAGVQHRPRRNRTQSPRPAGSACRARARGGPLPASSTRRGASFT